MPMPQTNALRHVRVVLRELIMVAITIIALLAVTFFIARVMPVDPVRRLSETMPAPMSMSGSGAKWGSINLS